MLPATSTAVTVTSNALPAVAVAGAVTTKWSSALPASSPTAKSPKMAIPVACVLVDVRVPVASGVHVPPEYASTANRLVSTPASRSPATNVKVAL